MALTAIQAFRLAENIEFRKLVMIAMAKIATDVAGEAVPGNLASPSTYRTKRQSLANRILQSAGTNTDNNSLLDTFCIAIASVYASVYDEKNGKLSEGSLRTETDVFDSVTQSELQNQVSALFGDVAGLTDEDLATV